MVKLGDKMEDDIDKLLIETTKQTLRNTCQVRRELYAYELLMLNHNKTWFRTLLLPWLEYNGITRVEDICYIYDRWCAYLIVEMSKRAYLEDTFLGFSCKDLIEKFVDILGVKYKIVMLSHDDMLDYTSLERCITNMYMDLWEVLKDLQELNNISIIEEDIGLTQTTIPNTFDILDLIIDSRLDNYIIVIEVYREIKQLGGPYDNVFTIVS